VDLYLQSFIIFKANVSPENMIAVFETVKKYGKYPIK
jgi:hypothetical protein